LSASRPAIASRANLNTSPRQIPGGREKRTADRLSKDGKWRSFSRIPHLLQYFRSGGYFARIKASGKLICQSSSVNVPKRTLGQAPSRNGQERMSFCQIAVPRRP
jgi:hypothetical protein